MRSMLLTAALVLGSCVAPDVTDPAAADVTAAIFVSEGGMMRPLANGGRIAVASGWATVSFVPFPPRSRSDLRIEVIDTAGRAIPAEVTVSHEMLGMDHGATTERALLDGSVHSVPMRFAMPGAWRVVVRIAQAGDVSTLVLVLPEGG